MKNILLVEDDKELSRSLANLFDPDKFRFEFLEDGQGVCQYLDRNEAIDLVLLDVNLPTMSGLEVLKQLRQSKQGLPVIVISGFVSTDDAIEAMREGAFEYLTKPFKIEKLIETVNKACGFGVGRREGGFVATDDKLQTAVDEIIGQSPEIVEIAKLIGQVSKTDAAVLIFGESGTGKELVARAVHRNSRRCNHPFLSVNCAALPETLLESELFGHEKGAFTGAYYKRIGKFEQADKGTLFLDEIADMSMLTQSKLLRVLQEKKIERVGGNESIDVDVRIVAATNKSLVEAMKEGSFRVDLFYRLKVVSLFLPPLRERRTDISLLVDHFCQKFAKQLQQPTRHVSRKGLQMLMKHPWPGNVRELENNIQTALVMSKNDALQPEDFPIFNEDKTGSVVDVGALKEDYCEAFRRIVDPVMPQLLAGSHGHVFQILEAAFEQAVIGSCLKQFDGNQVKSSEALGISRNTLRDRIARYGIY